MSRGAEFGEVQPLATRGGPIQVAPSIVLGPESMGVGAAINTAVIQQVTPLNSFRLGQQIMFWLGVVPGDSGEGAPWASRVRFKLWWARPNKEYRTPGNPQWFEIDRATFGNGPVLGPPVDPLANNRYVWIPSPKRLDVTPFGSAPPAIPVLPNSDSVFLDDCWTLDLPDPNDPTEQANFPAPQVVSRWDVFMYPAMGYALGLTWEPTAGGQVAPDSITISLTWSVGTLGGTNYQESIG
jgi:hypothetical protein